jgi:hypothetical protein
LFFLQCTLFFCLHLSSYLQNRILLPSYCLHLPGCPAFTAGALVLSPPFFSLSAARITPFLIIPAPQVVRMDLFGDCIRLSYHYPPRLSSTIFIPTRKVNSMISLCYFFPQDILCTCRPFPECLGALATIRAQALSTIPLRVQGFEGSIPLLNLDFYRRRDPAKREGSSVCSVEI